jgi:tetratricopeptide (TPR) repeat protein
MTKLRLLATALLAVGLMASAQAQGLRPEIGKPLQQASELVRKGDGRCALAKVREADNVGNKTAAEQLTIDRMKAAAAQRAGDNTTAVQALNAIYGKTSGAEQAQTAEQLAFAYSQLKDWPNARQWVDKAQQMGRSSASLTQLDQYLLSQSGDYNAIARDAAAAVSAAEKSGKRPEEGDLLRLADAQQRLNNNSAYIGTLEKLVAYHPKKDYWAAYLGRLTRKSGFSSRLGLDVMRLRLATDTLESTDDYMEMAQLALQSRLPAEGLKIVDKGFAIGKLGTGPEAGRHQRLKDLAIKRDAEKKASIAADEAAAQGEKSGDSLVEVGYAYVTMGQVAKGIGLIEQGIAKGDLKNPEDAKLRLGMAQIQAPATKAKGLQTLRSLKGTDGVAEIGRLWTVLAR